MPRISDISLFHCPRQYALTLSRPKLVSRDISRLISDGYARIEAYLGELGELAADFPFAAFSGGEPDLLTMQIVFPVSRSLPGKGDIETGVIPKGKVATCMYQGRYEEMASLYEEMDEWLMAHQLSAAGPSWECYYSGPEVPEERHLTRVSIPLLY